MRRDETWVRERFAEARVARLASVSADGSPHLVPIVFALSGNRIVSAVDAKPKTTTRLRRLDNIAANPSVSVLVDYYDDEWTQLWWARADGRASIVTSCDLTALVEKYQQYQQIPPGGPVIVIDVEHWTGWSYR